MRDYRPNYIPITDFARRVGMSYSRIRELVLEGVIKGVRLGRYYYVHEREARSARFLRRAGRWRRNDPGMRVPIQYPSGGASAVAAEVADQVIEAATPAVPEGETRC